MGAAAGILVNQSATDLVRQPTASTIRWVSFRELIEVTLPSCKASWSTVVAVEGAKVRRASELEPGFIDILRCNTQNCDPSGFLDIMLKRGETKQKLNMTLVIIRFLFGMHRRSEMQVTKRLRSLGREHARLGIIESHLNQFNNIVVRSIADHLGVSELCPSIMNWASLFGFVTREMTFESYKFSRNTSRKELETSGITTAYVSVDLESPLLAQDFIEDSTPLASPPCLQELMNNSSDNLSD